MVRTFQESLCRVSLRLTDFPPCKNIKLACILHFHVHVSFNLSINFDLFILHRLQGQHHMYCPWISCRYCMPIFVNCTKVPVMANYHGDSIIKNKILSKNRWNHLTYERPFRNSLFNKQIKLPYYKKKVRKKNVLFAHRLKTEHLNCSYALQSHGE